MDLAGCLRNNGSLTVASTGTLRNNGLIDGYDYDGSLTVEDGGELDTENGVLISRSPVSYTHLDVYKRQLLQSLAARWSSCEMSSTYPEEEHIYIKKMTRLDYADMDRQAVHDLYSQILQNKNWSSWGIRKTLYYFEELVGAAAQILGGAGLSVSLFLLKVPQESGFAFVNHPLIARCV